MHAGLRIAALALLAAQCLMACGSDESDATAVILRVDADADVKRAMRALNLRIHRDAGGGTWEQRLARGWETDTRFAWPAELPIVPSDEMLRTFEVVVEARAADGRLLAETRAVTNFVPQQVTALGLFLESKCFMLSAPCEPLPSVSTNECHGPRCMTCRGGRCVETKTSSLPSYRADEDVRALFQRSIQNGGSAGAPP